ncbi:hypothetical protein SALBM135S_04298 [Streptomyces alboniger]
MLRAAGVTISTDLHDWDGRAPYHEAFAYEADLVFLSTAALADPERTMRRIARRGRADAVAAHRRAEGAYLLTGGAVTHVSAAAPPAPVVDSNGAGDAFAAATPSWPPAGEPPARCALYVLAGAARARCPPPAPTSSPGATPRPGGGGVPAGRHARGWQPLPTA